MSTFDYRRNRRQQLVAKGEPVDNNISFDGKTKDFLNMFANKMKDTNNLYQSQRFPQFDDEKRNVSAEGVLQYMQGDPKSPPVNGQFPTDGVKVS